MKIGLQTDIPPCLPMAAGRYYFVPNSTSTSTSALTVDVLRCIPCFIPQRIDVTKIGCEVTGAGGAGSVVRLGIYATDPATMLPGALVVDAGTIDGTSATVQEIPLSGVTLSPGWYWFAMASQVGTAPTMRVCAAGSIVPPVSWTAVMPGVNSTTFGASRTGVTGAFPDPCEPSSFVTSGCPRIFIKT